MTYLFPIILIIFFGIIFYRVAWLANGCDPMTTLLKFLIGKIHKKMIRRMKDIETFFMKETDDDLPDNPEKKAKNIILTVIASIFFVLSIAAYSFGIQKSITGFTMGLQGAITCYGLTAILMEMFPYVSFFSNAPIAVLYPLCLIYQLFCILKCLALKKIVLFTTGLVLLELTVMAALVANNLSVNYRTNNIIPEEVSEYLSNTYGEEVASKMTIRIEKKVWDDSYVKNVYQVYSPDTDRYFEINFLDFYEGRNHTDTPVYEKEYPHWEAPVSP